jgi:hypothetical protein
MRAMAASLCPVYRPFIFSSGKPIVKPFWDACPGCPLKDHLTGESADIR